MLPFKSGKSTWTLFQGPVGHVQGKRGVVGGALHVLTHCGHSWAVFSRSASNLAWATKHDSGHGLHSRGSRMRPVELLQHWFSQIWRDDNPQSLHKTALFNITFVTSCELRFGIWITAFLNIPFVLYESQHLSEGLVASCISCNPLGFGRV